MERTATPVYLAVALALALVCCYDELEAHDFGPPEAKK
jgi:hypothetical protein